MNRPHFMARDGWIWRRFERRGWHSILPATAERLRTELSGAPLDDLNAALAALTTATKERTAA